PPGIGVDLIPDQLTDGGFAVALDGHRVAATCGNQSTAHHEQTVFHPLYEAFNQDTAPFLPRDAVCRLDFLARTQFDEYSATVIAITGLENNRQPEFLGCRPGVVGVANDPPFRHGNTARLEQQLRQLLVPGDAFSDGGRTVRFSCPDTL